MRLLRKQRLVYLAAPLFSEAELSFNLRLAGMLEEYVDIYLPQRDGGRLVDLVEKGVSVKSAYQSIFRRDIEALRESDALLFVLDGRSIDEGAAFELGFAYSLGKTCVGLQTDPRRLLPIGNNPMISEALLRIVFETSEVCLWAQAFATQELTVST